MQMMTKEEAYIQLSRQLCCQFLRILGDLVVEVDVGGMLEQMILPVHCLDNLGVAMPYADCNNPGKGLHDRKEAVSCATI